MNAAGAPLEPIRKRADFLAARDGRSANAPSFLLVCRHRQDGTDLIRFGLTVTKKLGGATVRNRIRRRLRALARLQLPLHGSRGHDYVFIARMSALTRSHPQLLDDLRRALQRLNRAAP